MDFSALFQPKNGRILVLLTAFLILYFNVYFLIIDDELAIYCSSFSGDCQPQPGLLGLFELEFPAVLFIVLWPMIFAGVNALHEHVRISSLFFYSIIAFHSITTLVTFLLFLSSFQPDSVSHQDGMNTAITTNVLTLASIAISVFVYYKKVMIFNTTEVVER